jgi:hypothetical protein
MRGKDFLRFLDFFWIIDKFVLRKKQWPMLHTV